MKIEVLTDADSVARAGATLTAEEARAAVAARGRFVVAFSGGHTPWNLGLGPDGHAASLVPGDPVLDVTDADVALTGVYQGRRRMTSTYPVLNRSRRIVWLVTGRDKADMLARLYKGDDSIPAGRIRRDQALVLADRDAAARTDSAPSRH